MKDTGKFAGFKKKLVEENEARYGEEIRSKYGEETIKKSNARMMGLSEEQFDRMQQMAIEINQGLEKAVQEGLEPTGEEGHRLAALHKEWLGFTWPSYSKEAHRGLVEMYVADERFTAYYDGNVSGCAEFLRAAVAAWSEEK